jgi:hypothetical protein
VAVGWRIWVCDGCEAVLFLCVGKNGPSIRLLGGEDQGRREKMTWVL